MIRFNGYYNLTTLACSTLSSKKSIMFCAVSTAILSNPSLVKVAACGLNTTFLFVINGFVGIGGSFSKTSMPAKDMILLFLKIFRQKYLIGLQEKHLELN